MEQSRKGESAQVKLVILILSESTLLFSGASLNYGQHATQSLPWQDRCYLQRD